MLGDDFGEGITSAWLRPPQFWGSLIPIGGMSTSIEPVAEGGGGRENICCAGAVTEPDAELCTPFGVGVVDCDCRMAVTNARASLDSSRLSVLIAESIHRGFSVR